MNYAQQKKKKPSPPPPLMPGPTFNLFLVNLPFEAKSKDLKEFFIAEGADVVSAEVIFQDNPRRSTGYGLVAFKTRKEAEEALSTFSDKVGQNYDYVTVFLSQRILINVLPSVFIAVDSL
jgi:polyadenylate-binding protein